MERWSASHEAQTSDMLHPKRHLSLDSAQEMLQRSWKGYFGELLIHHGTQLTTPPLHTPTGDPAVGTQKTAGQEAECSGKVLQVRIQKATQGTSAPALPTAGRTPFWEHSA